MTDATDFIIPFPLVRCEPKLRLVEPEPIPSFAQLVGQARSALTSAEFFERRMRSDPSEAWKACAEAAMDRLSEVMAQMNVKIATAPDGGSAA